VNFFGKIKTIFNKKLKITRQNIYLLDMQIVKVKTSQNIEIDYEVAGLGDRILARIVDMGVVMGFLYALYFITIFFFLSSFKSLDKGFPVFMIVLAVIFSIAFLFYDLVAEMYFNGQSIGKFAIKIRVIDLNGSRPTFGQLLIRWVFRLLDFGITFGFGALISVAISKNKQRIGDLIAGTTLIKTKPATQLTDLIFDGGDESYEPVFPQVNELNDEDINLIHEVITTYKSTGNNKVVYGMALKIQQHLGITIPPGVNDYDFLLIILKDYNHVASQVAL
jgi:uncharacterized RDD family membrane protein YckC